METLHSTAACVAAVPTVRASSALSRLSRVGGGGAWSAYGGEEGQQAAGVGQLGPQAPDGRGTGWDPSPEAAAPTGPCPRPSLAAEPLNPEVCVCDTFGSGARCQKC